MDCENCEKESASLCDTCGKVFCDSCLEEHDCDLPIDIEKLEEEQNQF